jgi:hypothetical protein
VESGDLVDTLVTVTTTGELKEGDKIQLGVGTTSSSSSNSTNNSSDPGGGIPIPGAGGPPGG